MTKIPFNDDLRFNAHEDTDVLPDARQRDLG
jgi:hypothetical protein